jgi:hypothetical protein
VAAIAGLRRPLGRTTAWTSKVGGGGGQAFELPSDRSGGVAAEESGERARYPPSFDYTVEYISGAA